MKNSKKYKRKRKRKGERKRKGKRKGEGIEGKEKKFVKGKHFC